MARPRQKIFKNLPKFVMMRNGRFYLEPKGLLRETLGGRASFPLGKSFGEMHQNYTEITKNLIPVVDSGYTLSDLIHSYLRDISATSKASATYETDVKSANAILKRFSQFRPEDIRKKHITKYQAKRWDELQKKNKALYEKKVKEKYFNSDSNLIPDDPIKYFGNRTVNKEVAFLSAVMSYAVDLEIIDKSPCANIKYRVEESRKRYISHEEFENFCSFAKARNPLLAAYIRFRYITGRRDCEIRALRREHVGTEGITFYIAKKAKRGAKTPVLQVWNNSFWAAYKELAEASAMVVRSEIDKQFYSNKNASSHLLCNRQGVPYTADGWSGIFRKIMNEALKEGVLEMPFTLHDIRSKTATDIGNLAEASDVLAQSNFKTTDKHYMVVKRKIAALDTDKLEKQKRKSQISENAVNFGIE